VALHSLMPAEKKPKKGNSHNLMSLGGSKADRAMHLHQVQKVFAMRKRT
jgi:hypothetical protein